MYRLKIALRTLLVICALAFTAAAQTGGANIGGGGIQWTGGDLTAMNHSSPSPSRITITGGKETTAEGGGASNSQSNLPLTLIISLLTNGMPLIGF